MSDSEAMKRRATTRVIGDATANVLDALAVRVERHVPAETTYTRDEVAEMLRGMAEMVRVEGA